MTTYKLEMAVRFDEDLADADVEAVDDATLHLEAVLEDAARETFGELLGRDVEVWIAIINHDGERSETEVKP